MDFNSLDTFVAVAETGSFSRAAERLFITQPAISKRIAALEDTVGAQLLDRLGRTVQLTEAGQILLISARRILADIASSREQIHSLSVEVGGRLRLGTSHHVGIHRLPPVLKAYTQAYPQVDLDLLFMDSEKACEQVATGSLELAIVTLPNQADPNLAIESVWPDPLTIVCALDHPLAGKSRTSPAQLAKHAAVLPARGTVTRSILFSALAPYNVSIKTALETNYLETIKMMVSVGLGWSALPLSMVDNSIGAIRVRGLQMQRELGSVYLRGRTLSRAAQALLAMLSTEVIS